MLGKTGSSISSQKTPLTVGIPDSSDIYSADIFLLN